MTATKSPGAVAAAGAVKLDELGQRISAQTSLPHNFGQAIRADLIGANACIALDTTARGFTAVLALCRRLIQAGHNPSLPLHAYRGHTLALVIRSIGESAKLDINSKGTGFIPLRAVRRGSHNRENEEASIRPSAPAIAN